MNFMFEKVKYSFKPKDMLVTQINIKVFFLTNYNILNDILNIKKISVVTETFYALKNIRISTNIKLNKAILLLLYYKYNVQKVVNL